LLLLLLLQIPNELGVGTMAWGDVDRGFISDPRQRPKAGQFNPADLQGAYEALLEAGINYFDTADVYGYKSIK
jgi:aryl-alcohol dehydrogenase-like predicted oxidoreductase